MASNPEPHSHGLTPGAIGLFAVRYGIGAVMVIAGIVLLIAVPGTGVDGFAMAVGGGLAVVLINVLFRFGAEGDIERLREEEARQFFDAHGYWPDEAPAEERGWHLPPGVVTPEQERDERDRAARERGEREAARPESAPRAHAEPERPIREHTVRPRIEPRRRRP